MKHWAYVQYPVDEFVEEPKHLEIIVCPKCKLYYQELNDDFYKLRVRGVR